MPPLPPDPLASEEGLRRAMDEGLILDALGDLVHRRALIATASRYGSTREIGDRIAARMRAHGMVANSIAAGDDADVTGYDIVVVGSGVYRGHWLPDATAFAKQHADALRARSVWLFSSGPVGDLSRRIVRAMDADPVEVAQLTPLLQPAGTARFGGRMDLATLPLRHRLAAVLMRFGGDFRDLDAIDEWADAIVRRSAARPMG